MTKQTRKLYTDSIKDAALKRLLKNYDVPEGGPFRTRAFQDKLRGERDWNIVWLEAERNSKKGWNLYQYKTAPDFKTETTNIETQADKGALIKEGNLCDVLHSCALFENVPLPGQERKLVGETISQLGDVYYKNFAARANIEFDNMYKPMPDIREKTDAAPTEKYRLAIQKPATNSLETLQGNKLALKKAHKLEQSLNGIQTALIDLKEAFDYAVENDYNSFIKKGDYTFAWHEDSRKQKANLPRYMAVNTIFTPLDHLISFPTIASYLLFSPTMAAWVWGGFTAANVLGRAVGTKLENKPEMACPKRRFEKKLSDLRKKATALPDGVHVKGVDYKQALESLTDDIELSFYTARALHAYRQIKKDSWWENRRAMACQKDMAKIAQKQERSGENHEKPNKESIAALSMTLRKDSQSFKFEKAAKKDRENRIKKLLGTTDTLKTMKVKTMAALMAPKNT